MPFQIVRSRNGWVTNSKGEVLVLDSEIGTTLWIPANTIKFNASNKPLVGGGQDDEADAILEYVLTNELGEQHSHEINAARDNPKEIENCQLKDYPENNNQEEIEYSQLADNDNGLGAESYSQENYIDERGGNDQCRSTWQHNHTIALINCEGQFAVESQCTSLRKSQEIRKKSREVRESHRKSREVHKKSEKSQEVSKKSRKSQEVRRKSQEVYKRLQEV